MAERAYLPAAGRDAFLPLYDPLTRLLGIRSALAALIDQAQLGPADSILDVGCGTGTLVVEIKRRYPGVSAIGIDPDPRALERAKRKAERARASAGFDRAFADALPFPDASFDRVFSSMMFHHLPAAERPAVLAEIRRVLRPGGRLEFLDFAGGGRNLLAQMLHGGQLHTAAEARLMARFSDAGFTGARRVSRQTTLVGVLACYQASRE